MSQDDPVQHPPETPPRPRRRLHSVQETRTRRRRFLMYAVLGSSFVLMVNALVGENGYVATVRAQREYAAVASSLAARQLENEKLLGQIRRLKNDPGELEEAARRLGLIRPGETLVVIRDVRPAPGPAAK
jgi:cell division protein FtsB